MVVFGVEEVKEDCLNKNSTLSVIVAGISKKSFRKLIEFIFFMLGCKNSAGFLFVMFDFIIPILEQLE